MMWGSSANQSRVKFAYVAPLFNAHAQALGFHSTSAVGHCSGRGRHGNRAATIRRKCAAADRTLCQNSRSTRNRVKN